MSCIRGNSPSVRLGLPTLGPGRTCSLSQVQFAHLSPLYNSAARKFEGNKMPRLVCNSLKYKTYGPICLLGGKGNSGIEKKVFSWDSLKDAWKDWRQGRTVEDMLQQQIRQQEYDGNGGDGNPPKRGGGGSGGTEDQGFTGILDETLQVFLATMALIFVYTYMIRGAEFGLLIRDYIKYLLGSVPSRRLQSALRRWKRWKRFIRRHISREKFIRAAARSDWLERLILRTRTRWYDPSYYNYLLARLSQLRKGRSPEISSG